MYVIFLLSGGQIYTATVRVLSLRQVLRGTARSTSCYVADASTTSLASAGVSSINMVRPDQVVSTDTTQMFVIQNDANGAPQRHTCVVRKVGTFGHLGDGNLHPTFLTNERDHEEMHRIEAALEEIVEETIRVGGTVTGEHGVGLAKKGFLKRQLGEGSYELMRSIKRALDPQGLLNPGKIFD